MKKLIFMFYMLFLLLLVGCVERENNQAYTYQYSAPVLIDNIALEKGTFTVYTLMETGSEYSIEVDAKDYEWIEDLIGQEINGVFGVREDGSIRLINFVKE